MTTTEYLQREIRRVELSIRRAERKPNTPPEEMRGLHDKMEHLQEALEAVEEHWQRVHEQRGCTAGEPLTLEQLRGMGKKPYWHVGLQADSQEPHWAILDPFVARRPEDYGYGERWLAYTYPPAHIDREKWTAEWVDNDHSEEMMCKCSKCGYPVSYFWGKTAFCPGCGRAMTTEAWAELEKRLGGEMNE